ncbi:FecR domain-containing protein [Hydrocarboniclastica marina]|uniref:FecR protein domain-containing protein n=1 Tax=Hydrocarboniclastica marina TaxID=2259620 RepID=A0A4P7XL33_9ALTE|nr:FecR domain-containing protein [Hydrocarboniclastica marina]QCF27082.1 hypothetical protein soil367_14710 [Hydrocarboniclastica marina]
MLGRTRIHLPGGARPSNGYRLYSSLPLLVLASLTGLAPGLGLAQPVMVEAIKGDAEFRQGPEKDWAPLTSGQTLSLPAEIRTGKTGTATLRQTESSFELKPTTALALSAEDNGDEINNVNQSSGTVFYTIQDQTGKLNIVTPTLRSTVEGTQFAIVATETDSFVTLTEGELTVIDRRTGEMQNLNPGEVASSSVTRTGIATFNSVPPRAVTGSATEAEQNNPTPYGIDAPPGEDGFDAALAGLDEMAAEQQMVAAEESGAFAAEDDMAADDPGMIEDDMPANDEGPVQDDMPTEDQSPVEDDMPADDQGPVEDDMPTDDQGPVEDDMPTDDQGPVEDDMPTEDQGPVEDDMPTDDQGPVEDDMPGEDEGPVEDDMPTEDEGPVEDDLPTEDQGPGGDDLPDEGVPDGDDEIAGDEGSDGDKGCRWGWCDKFPFGDRDD